MSVLPARPIYGGVQYVGANPKLAVTLSRLGGIIKPYTTIELWEVGTSEAVIWQAGTGDLARYVPDGVLIDGKTYRWRARGRDAQYSTVPYGPWSAWSTITADTVAPTPPTIASLAYPQDQTVASGGVGEFTITSTGIEKEAAELCYSFDAGTAQCSSGGLLADGRRSTTASITPAEGWHSLAAWTVDYAGNVAESATYEFGLTTTNEKTLGPDYETIPSLPIPPSVPDPTPTGDPTALPTVGGTLKLPNGNPAVGFVVNIYPVAEGESAPIAEATTGNDGSWSVTLTNLSPALQAEAIANDGVLNVDAVALGQQNDGTRDFAGVMSLQTGVAAAGTLTEAAVLARQSPRFSAPLVPILTEPELQPTPTAAEYANSFAGQEIRNPTSVTTEDTAFDFHKFLPATSPSRDPQNPNIIGSTNYANTVVQPFSGGFGVQADGRMAAAASCSSMTTRTDTISTNYAYTTVGEHHAYWDVTGKATYGVTANSDLTVGLSYNSGSSWGASGTAHVGNNWGYTANSGARGPYYSRELDVPMQYKRYRIYYCNSNTRQWKYAYDTIKPIKVYVPNGWYASRAGANLISMDGYYKWAAAPYRYKITRNMGYSQTSGKTRGFGAAASLFGFGVTATTSRSTSRQQDYDAGSKTGPAHDIFMQQCMTCGPKGFYSY
ncbi:hypothetical protein F8271_28695 [Micromonospora sp. ALFpr18c]|uniref:hypothetical protein n=1 Tax=unclassified Micromonospora TaxID=2617518 RepID=UPI00124BA2E0|nr:hypothetical protein [Micromonospora sp. ALFpr18c]KAB1929630.1 hypothetical protein F8271_28695 [Micromonospora sp. ALFpr18c]